MCQLTTCRVWSGRSACRARCGPRGPLALWCRLAGRWAHVGRQDVAWPARGMAAARRGAGCGGRIRGSNASSPPLAAAVEPWPARADGP
jgi:hypothetical protein